MADQGDPQDISQRCFKAASEGDVEELYRLIKEDRRVLDEIDNTPFSETLLHRAAAKGHVSFALEIMALKPSLSRKLNEDGLTPLHLALQEKRRVDVALQEIQAEPNQALQQPNPNASLQEIQTEPNQALQQAHQTEPNQTSQQTQSESNHPTQPNLTPTPEQSQPDPNPALQQTQSTPTHALQANLHTMVLCLLEFDKDLARVKGRGGLTPFHYAAQIGDLEVLIEVLIACPTAILDVTAQGETILHVALKNNQLKAFQLLKRWLWWVTYKDAFLWRLKLQNWKDINGDTFSNIEKSKNLFTSFDIFQSGTQVDNQGIHLLLRRDRALGTLPEEVRNALLVVVALLLTITFQVILSPPGGAWQDDGKSDDGKSHRAGTAIMGSHFFKKFEILCTLSFFLSFTIAILLLPRSPLSLLCSIPIGLLAGYWYISSLVLDPDPECAIYAKKGSGLVRMIGFIIYVIVVSVFLVIGPPGSARISKALRVVGNWRRRRRPAN